MDQQYSTIDEWVASTCRRNEEYARLAFEEIQKHNDESAKMYLSNLVGSLQTLADFYPDNNAIHPQQLTLAKDKRSFWKKLGLTE